MNRRRFATGAAIAGVLATAPAALASSSPNPGEAPDGTTPAGSVTTIPLPDAIAQCLTQNGLPAPSAGTMIELPAVTGAPPASLAGTIPLPATGVPTTTGAIPLPATGTPTTTGALPLPGVGVPTTTTMPLSGVGVPTTTTMPLPGVGVPATNTSTSTSTSTTGAGSGTGSGTSPLPAGGLPTGTAALDCGQLIINNLVYVVLLPLTNNITTNTTTTTTANGPMTAANGPVTITDNAPVAAPVTTTDNAPAPAPTTPVVPGKGKHKATHRRHRRKRSTTRRHSTHNRAGRGTRALQIVLYRKSRGDKGLRRVTALVAHAGRGS
jgi:hypothetical protein